MEYSKGKNVFNGKSYLHSPDSEKELFADILKHHLTKNEGQIYGIEIGVLNGETSSFLLSIDSRINLIGIDPIVPDSMEPSLIGSAMEIYQNVSRYEDRFSFIQDYSSNVCSSFDDNMFDFVFIDGDHRYSEVKKDFDNYFEKIKSGGFIFMHDSRMFRRGAPFHIGSSKFCDELIAMNKKIELVGEAFSLTCFRKK